MEGREGKGAVPSYLGLAIYTPVTTGTELNMKGSNVDLSWEIFIFPRPRCVRRLLVASYGLRSDGMFSEDRLRYDVKPTLAH